jgi:hypothetical protein
VQCTCDEVFAEVVALSKTADISLIAVLILVVETGEDMSLIFVTLFIYIALLSEEKKKFVKIKIRCLIKSLLNPTFRKQKN